MRLARVLACSLLLTACEQESADGDSGEVICSDDGCFQSCVLEETPEEAAGEVCISPAAEHESWACQLDSICDDLVLDGSADLDAARCVIAALRDRTPGALHVQRQEAGSDIEFDFYILSDGTALLDAEGPAGSSCVGREKKSSMGALELRASDDAFWQGCIDATSDAELVACLFAVPSSDEAFLTAGMPWQAPTCTTAAASCDG